ncbi:MAG: DUF4382 domain-containing protein [Bacteroidales bacterium]
MKSIGKLIVFGMILTFVAGCNNQDFTGYGTLKLSITDAPFPLEYIDSANVTITKVEVRAQADTTETDTVDSEFFTVMEESRTFNLLELRNGVMEVLGEIDLEEGNYDLIRVYVEEASLSVAGGETFNLMVPSGSQTGIKVFVTPAISINDGMTSEVLLDFSLERSFILKGNMDTPAGIIGFNFVPVIRAVDLAATGTVSGMVSDTAMNAIGNASVWISQDTVIASAMTDTTGYYAIPGITAGTYTLSATAAGYDTLTVNDVVVNAGSLTEVDFEFE